MSFHKASLVATHPTIRAVFIILVALFLIFGLFQMVTLRKEVDTLKADLASTTLALTYTADILSKNFNELSRETAGLSSTLSKTEQTINTVTSKVGGVEQAVGSISGTVGTLQKLSQIEEEILKKYSKVYFMNDNYSPERLTIIPEEYTYSSAKKEYFLTEGWRYLQALLDASKKDGVNMYIKSAYRSFGEQKTLKSIYTITYGSGANTFSADQGYSEHQLGSTVDFITTGQGGELNGFDKTQAYTWLTENAYKYGFVLSYPKGNAYYIFEPWHWRFVGVKLATFLHENNLNFYDMDQREIDKYLLSTFD